MTRQPAVEPVEAGIVTLGGVRPAGNRHVRRASRNGPTLGVRPPFAAVTLNPASSRPGGPRAATGEDVLLRLALWLADVAAEAALAAASSTPGTAARHLGRAEEPPMVESAP